METLNPVSAKLKYKIKDFIVEEIGEKWNAKISEDFQPNSNPNLDNLDLSASKEFLCCEMEKQDIDHFSAIKEIARLLNKRVI